MWDYDRSSSNDFLGEVSAASLRHPIKLHLLSFGRFSFSIILFKLFPMSLCVSILGSDRLVKHSSAGQHTPLVASEGAE